MAQPHRPEAGGRYVELAESRRGREVSGFVNAGQEPTIPSAVEKLVAASQGVITKRIDLVMLEVHELLGRLVMRSALIAFGIVVAVAAWFAAVGAIVLYLFPGAGPIVHLGMFALVNAAVGAAIVAAGAVMAVNKLPVLGAEAEGQNTPQDS